MAQHLECTEGLFGFGVTLGGGKEKVVFGRGIVFAGARAGHPAHAHGILSRGVVGCGAFVVEAEGCVDVGVDAFAEFVALSQIEASGFVAGFHGFFVEPGCQNMVFGKEGAFFVDGGEVDDGGNISVVGCRLEPSFCFAGVGAGAEHAHAEHVLSYRAVVEFGVFGVGNDYGLLDGLGEEFLHVVTAGLVGDALQLKGCVLRSFLWSGEFGAETAQGFCGIVEAAGGCEAVAADGFVEVDAGAYAFFIAHAETVLPGSEVQRRCFGVPAESCHGVVGHAAAGFVVPAYVCHGTGVAGVGGPFVEFESFVVLFVFAQTVGFVDKSFYFFGGETATLRIFRKCHIEGRLI